MSLGRDVTIGGETLKIVTFRNKHGNYALGQNPDSRRPWPTLVAPAFGERFCRELRHLLRAVVESSGPPSQDRVSADNWLNQFNPARNVWVGFLFSRVRGGTPSWACPLAPEEVLLIGEPLRKTFVQVNYPMISLKSRMCAHHPLPVFVTISTTLCRFR